MKKYGVCYRVSTGSYLIYPMDKVADYTDKSKYILYDELKGLFYSKAETECGVLNEHQYIKLPNPIKPYFVYYDIMNASYFFGNMDDIEDYRNDEDYEVQEDLTNITDYKKAIDECVRRDKERSVKMDKMKNTYFVFYDKSINWYNIEVSRMLSVYKQRDDVDVMDKYTGLSHDDAKEYAAGLNLKKDYVARLTEKVIMLNSTTDRTSLINDKISTHSHHAYIGFNSYMPYFNAVGIDENTKLTIMFPNDNKGYMIITHWVSDMIDYLRVKMGSTENVQNNVTIYFNEKYVDEFPYIEFFKNVKYY